MSLAEAKSLRVEPGSPLVNKGSLGAVRRDLVVGLSMVEGSLPPNHVNPLLHRLVHYPTQTASYGRIWGFAMWAFERYNKLIKGMVKNNSSAEESIASNTLLAIATRFVELASDDIHSDDQIAELRKRRTSCSIQSIRVHPYR